MHDLVIHGGRVVDPSQGLDAELDVAIDGTHVVAVGRDLAAGGTRALVEAAGQIVTPGLVDLHTHVFWGVAPLGVEADPHCLSRGVTTAIDAGSAGASTFGGFRRYVIDVSATRILAMLNISTIGMARDDRADEPIGELEEIRWANVDRAVQVARAHADLIVGIKVRLGEGQVGRDAERCREALRRSRQAAEAVGKPVMVHIGRTPVPLDEILASLGRGDVVTHVFHGNEEGVLDERGRVRQSVRDAAERGVGFDVGHGAGSFSYDVARRALDQGFEPATISSDIHTWSVAGPAFDLATTATKLLHLGLPLDKVVHKITAAPAAAVGMAGRIGTLAPGAEADVTVLTLANGEFHLPDTKGRVEVVGRRLEPVLVVRGGRIHTCTPASYPTPAHAH
jgi:dihydroorotase